MLFKTALAIFTLALSVAATPFNLEPRGKPCSGPTGADDCEDHCRGTQRENGSCQGSTCVCSPI
ncbi:hypothetical protein MCOR27_003530 [Pyricularia oryzae]|nr:hypothetical protein MCOR01_006820 [Pyricularia oryzae]KAI6265682.1 hypothetical protein MCOR26_010610 [Pyricularia oryzae]KAI6282938.1 hypothetical protein MCOR27_003530 [Pyricularia oryzae]KAI6332903.1 hypothetical protein MCOR28_010723 [Pyricularia oryzae]KAI6359092.1 hypothetical protein MCOR31_009580 [Pyricularia oryzae]